MMNESEHIIKAQLGDSQAFGHLYDFYSQRIYAFLLSRLRHKQIAEDLLQETFIKAWKALPNFHNEGNFNAWLYRIATNNMNDLFRKNTSKPEALALEEDFIIEDKAAKPDEEFDNSLSEVTMQQALDQLPATYRQVLTLRFKEGLSTKDVGLAVNKSSIAVRLIQYRALKKLKIIINHSYAKVLL
jgi:RNA polymerase sigma-70 factor (ECF subfamily)